MSRLVRVVLVVVGLVLVAALLGGIKVFQFRKMMAFGAALQKNPPAEAITTAKVISEDWTPMLRASGSLTAVQGVTISAELPGKVVAIGFQPGAKVKAGDLLIRQDTSSERAQLQAASARLALARANLARIAALHAKKVVATAQLDEVRAQAAQAAADAAGARAAIQKKTLRAPFAGRLGIRLVNLGQVVSTGTAVVSLQSIDPIFVNFSLPQQNLDQVRVGLPVRLKATALRDEIKGTITAINPHVNASTRNLELQATVANPQEALRPGMFVEVSVILPDHRKVLAIPEPAVLHAPYGDSVFVVEPGGQGRPVVRQQFVRLGERRGDFVAVVGGLAPGQVVASTGAFKLRNGQPVQVHNALSPSFKLTPRPKDS